MKYIKYIKNYFYSVEKKSSYSQIVEDFGGSPPLPLECKNSGIEFNILKTRGIGALYDSLLIFNKLVFQVKSINDVHENYREALNDIFVTKMQFKEARKAFFDTMETKNWIFLFLISPLIFLCTPIILLLLIFKLRYLPFNFYRMAIPRSAGYFLQIFVDQKRIVIKVDKLKKGEYIKTVISHEHIHLLQNEYGEIDNKIVNCENILIPSQRNNGSLLYTLEKKEVEARLHEIVVSYYSIKSFLPLTLEGLVEMLAGNNEFGSLVMKTMGLSDATTESSITKYDERSMTMAVDIHIILLSIKSLDLRQRFITEVLAVMYGNLIKYYGDGESSRHFLNGIDRPNLYDILYGQQDPNSLSFGCS